MKVFIGSGSKETIPVEYLKETKKVCSLLCEHDYYLVFGAYSKGMMGQCFKTFKENYQKVFGYTLKEYESDLVNLKGANVFTIDNSFDRLKIIYEVADLFLFLPGGTGALAELFGIMEENKTNKSNKKIIIYNYNHYYDDIFNFLKDKKDFIYEDEINKIVIVDNLKDLEGEI